MHLAALLVWSMDSPWQRLSLWPAGHADRGALAELGWGGKAPQHPSNTEHWNEDLNETLWNCMDGVAAKGAVWGDIKSHWSLLRLALRIFSQIR